MSIIRVARDVLAAPVRRMRGVMGLGNVPQQPDPRDYDIAVLQLTLDGAAQAFDCDGFGRIVDQGAKNCCVGEAGAGTLNICEDALGVSNGGRVSADMLWSVAKLQIGRGRENSGTSIRDMWRGMARLGACDEQFMPRSTPFTALPSAQAYANAVGRRMHTNDPEKRVGGYYAVRDTRTAQAFDTIAAAIWTRRPIVCGSSFIPNALTESIGPGSKADPIKWADLAKLPSTGGHAFILDGYDLDRGLLRMRNSWGQWWRQGGCAWLDAEASLPYLRDFWVVDGYPRIAAARKGLVLHAQ